MNFLILFYLLVHAATRTVHSTGTFVSSLSVLYYHVCISIYFFTTFCKCTFVGLSRNLQMGSLYAVMIITSCFYFDNLTGVESPWCIIDFDLILFDFTKVWHKSSVLFLWSAISSSVISACTYTYICTYDLQSILKYLCKVLRKLV